MFLTVESLICSASSMLLHFVLRILFLKLQFWFFVSLVASGFSYWVLSHQCKGGTTGFGIMQVACCRKIKTYITVSILSAECTHCFIDQVIHSFDDISVFLCLDLHQCKKIY